MFCGELGRFFTSDVGHFWVRGNVFPAEHLVLHDHSIQQIHICFQLKSCQGVYPGTSDQTYWLAERCKISSSFSSTEILC